MENSTSFQNQLIFFSIRLQLWVPESKYVYNIKTALYKKIIILLNIRLLAHHKLLGRFQELWMLLSTPEFYTNMTGNYSCHLDYNLYNYNLIQNCKIVK